VLWEIGEWLYELGFGAYLIKSRYDTAADLAADLAGAFTGAVLGAWATQPRAALLMPGKPAAI
jgi:hypothetical protein